MATDRRLVPSREVPDGLAALRLMLPGASWLHGAVAFVSQGGVDIVVDLLDEVGAPPAIELVVRGAPVSEPQAVLALRDRLNADVRVVLGARAARFHPKLWMSQTEKATWVLSGSGNVTAGGLRDNHEQFELLRFARSDLVGRDLASEHMRRMRQFRNIGLKLSEAVGTEAWETWQTQLLERESLQARQRELDGALAAADAEPEVAQSAGRGGSLELSAATEESTIRGWMRRWYPDREQQQVVWDLLAEVMAAAHAHRRAGWAACAVWYGHDVHPRLAVYCGVSQVFVAHSRRGLIFEAPPQHADADAYEAATRLVGEIADAVNEPWGEGGYRHPCVVVPTANAVGAREAGLEAVRGAIRWRSPQAEGGAAGHGRFHCADWVRAVSREADRPLDQPGYHPWRP